MFGIDEVLSIGGAAAGLFSSIGASGAASDTAHANAKAAKAAAKANAEISEYDATVAEKDAIAAEFQAGVAFQQHQTKVDSLLSNQRARYAKSGVVVNAGTPLEVMVKTAGDAAKDAELIKYNGLTKAQRYRSLASRYRMLADAGLRDAAMQAANIEEAGEYESRGYLMTGFANAFSDVSDIYQNWPRN